MTCVVVVGVLLRLQGQVSIVSGLWFDEAVWGMRVGVQSVFSHNIRPFGFMWATKLLVNAFGPSEYWLRFIPNAAAIASMCLAPALAALLLRSKVARLVFAIVFAFHPGLIDFAKEFKPYSWEVFVHLGLITLYLAYRRSRRPALLYALLAALPVAFVFAYNVSFAFPGLLLLALYDGCVALRSQGVKPLLLRGALPPVLSGALCLGVTAAVYFTLLTNVTTEKTEDYWGKKYKVFYQRPDAAAETRSDRPPAPEARLDPAGEGGDGAPEAGVPADEPELPFSETRAGWLLDKYADVAALPGLRRTLWKLPESTPAWLAERLPMADKVLWVGLHFAGLVALLLARRFRELVVLWLPLGCLIACNAFGLWPMGAFRTNLFLCAYALPLAAVGADALIVGSNLRAWLLVAALSMVYLAPGVAFGHDFRGRKQMWTRHIAARTVLKQVIALRERELAEDPKAPKALVLIDMHSSRPVNYYLGVHPKAKVKYGPFFQEQIRLKLALLTAGRIKRELARQKDRPLIVVSSRRIEALEASLRANFQVLSLERIDDEHLVAAVARKRAR